MIESRLASGPRQTAAQQPTPLAGTQACAVARTTCGPSGTPRPNSSPRPGPLNARIRPETRFGGECVPTPVALAYRKRNGVGPAPLRPELERRWLDAERSVIEGLRDNGMRDAYRSLHGPASTAFSWEHGSSKNRYRYDHVLVSREFTPTTCDYLHEFRLNGSHHAAIQAQLAWA